MQYDYKKSSNSNKVKKGFLAVQVGENHDYDYDDCINNNNNNNYYYYHKKELQKFVIPIGYLYHPLFIGLLDRAREVYGYHVDGPLRLPCPVDDFIHLCWMIEKESHSSGSHRRHDHNQQPPQLFNHAPSFRSC
ncbi:Auxin-responsive protein SAUR32 [Bienertia sinuspersici]